MEKKTILIAENSLINRTYLCGILCDEYKILEAEDGQQALDIMRREGNKIAVLLLDIMMPKKDGYQVMVEMNDDPVMKGIPVIVVTAENDRATEIRALSAGAFDFLSKPIEPEIAKWRIKAVVSQKDLEELHLKAKVMEELQYQSDHDELTGIYSQSAFCREARRLIDAGKGVNFTLIRWDIEKFKLVNELFAVATGDRMLKAAAQSMAHRMKGRGVFARWESDNFVMCFPDSAVAPVDVMDAIVGDIRDNFEEAGLTQSVVVASGVYRIDDPNLQITQMCDRAGMAMQMVKGDYNRHMAFYDDEMRQRIIDEQDILDNMEAALQNNEFEVYLQPVYDILSGHPASAEALVRWNRPGRGVISPGVFIPLFERNGFVSKLDYYVWDRVCHIQMKRAEEGLTPMPISVNFSRKSLFNPYVYEQVVALTEEHCIDPSLFRIEVTESAYMDNAAQLIETVEKLQAYGYPVLLDDFGSGYSSFNTLKDIPVDILKIDMKFMEGFENGGRVGTILASILRMTKWLGIPVIAEGVETVDQYEFLRSIGCEFNQGFYFARPMRYEDFERHISELPQETNPEKATYTAGDVDEIMGAGGLFDRVLNEVTDAYAIYEFHDGRLEIVRVNEGHMRLFGMNKASVYGNRGDDIQRAIPEDRLRTIDACRRAIDTGEAQDVLISCTEGGSTILLHCTCMCLSKAGEQSALMFIASHIVGSDDPAIQTTCPVMLREMEIQQHSSL